MRKEGAVLERRISQLNPYSKQWLRNDRHAVILAADVEGRTCAPKLVGGAAISGFVV
jgi:hypothetical protein